MKSQHKSFSTIAMLIASIGLFQVSAWAQSEPKKTPAQVEADLKRIEPLVPAGYEVAMSYLFLRPGFTPQDLGLMADSYVFADFNHDGRVDLAVAFEEIPKVETEPGFGGGAPYETLIHGHRTLRIFMGLSDGSLAPAAANENILRQGDEGGATDPFGGLKVNSRGSLVVSQYSGRGAYHGAITYKIQYRVEKGVRGFYRVGVTRDSDDQFRRWHQTVDLNDLTGMELTTVTIWKQDEEQKESEKQSWKNLGRKPLIPFAQIPDAWK